MWIDAISSNQDDIPEGNQQVSRMGTLYSMADEVLVWLGLEANGSTQALTFVEESLGSPKDASPSIFSLESYSRIIESLISLTTREYWQLAWIIQEVFRAQKLFIHCGLKMVEWRCLANFFRRLEKYLEDERPKTQEYLVELHHSLAARFARQRTAQNLDLEIS